MKSRVGVARNWGWGKWGEAGQRVQIISFKMNRF